MGRCGHRQDRGSGRPVASKIMSSWGGKLGIRRVTVTSTFVMFVAAGCGTTSVPSAFEALPPETTATQTTVPATAHSAPATTAPVPTAAVPTPKKPATTVLAPAPTPRPSRSAPVQGSNSAVWVSTFCGGLNDENAASSALSQSPQSLSTAVDVRNEMLQYLDTVEQALATTAHKLTQLGAPRVAGGQQVQDNAVGFFTTTANTFGDHRAKIAALDVNDPDLAQKASQLMPGPSDLSATGAQLNEVTNNQELASAFFAAPECQRLASPPTPR